MTGRVWLCLEEICHVQGRPPGTWADSYWDHPSSIVEVHLKLPAGLQPRVSGANAGSIAWGLIAPEAKDW